LQIAKTFLAVYAWIVIGVLFFFLWRIADFYERASGQRVGHRFLVLPGLLLAAGAMWYLLHDSDFVAQPVGDLLLFGGGLLLLLFGARLERLMTGER
jgi:hypothetical protein